MYGFIGKVICKNSSATIQEILFNIAIPIIYHKLYSNGEEGLSSQWGFCENTLWLWKKTSGSLTIGNPFLQNPLGHTTWGFWKFYTGVKFSLTPPPIVVCPRGLMKTGFLLWYAPGGLSQWYRPFCWTPSFLQTPLILMNPPFICDTLLIIFRDDFAIKTIHFYKQLLALI